jgi:hypothetical protein
VLCDVEIIELALVYYWFVLSLEKGFSREEFFKWHAFYPAYSTLYSLGLFSLGNYSAFSSYLVD